MEKGRKLSLKKNKKKSLGLSLKPNKAFLKQLVLAMAVIFMWYGTWAGLDLLLPAEDPILRVTGPMIVGLFLLYLLDEENEIEEITEVIENEVEDEN